MQPSCQLNWSELYDNMAKFQLRRAEFQNIGAQLDGQQAQFLSDVNAIFLDMSPILSMTGALEDSRMTSSDVTGLFDSLVQQLPNTLNEELDLLGPFSPLEANDWNNCLELDLDGAVDDGGFAVSKNVVGGDGSAVPGGGGGGDDVGPTLAELNYDAEALDDLDLENLSLPEENNCFVRGSSNLPTPTHDECLGLPPPTICENRSQNSSVVAVAPVAISCAVAVNSAAAVVPNSVGEQIESVEDIPKSALHALLVRCRENRDGARNACMSSRSSDDQVAYPKIKEEPLPVVEKSGHEQRVVPNIRSQGGARLSTSSVDTLLDVKELNAKDADSHDEGFDSDLEDSDHYDFSDADSDNSWTGEQASRYDDRDQLNKQRKKERFFWQYNLQAKGPKGTRLPLAADSLDPHTLDEITDPVFSPSCQVKGIKHTGKARRGDGNDLNPNPAKLFHIGRELKKLNKVINDLTPVSELPFNVRPKSRKEKNKLASRACRLKKKAQHEANKLKLYGLDHEHRRLMHVLDEVKKSVLKRTSAKKESSAHSSASDKLTEQCELLSKTFLKTEVAGRTADFVNLVLDKVATGIPINAIDQL